MARWIKRIAAALLIKKGIERVQEARRPKRSRGRSFVRLLTLAGIGGGIGYLYKTGKLEPILEQAKEALGGREFPRGDEIGDADWNAPAATAGATTVGASSTSSSV